MKPAPFAYHAPTSIEEAVGMLGELAGQDGRMLRAGIRTGWLTARKHLFGSIPGMLRKAA